MTGNDMTPQELVNSFDEIRPSFLAALDQIVAEIRPNVLGIPGYYTESVRACAESFADPAMIRDQINSVLPGLADALRPDEINGAHLTSVSYLFSLALHELMRNQTELPTHPLKEQ
jgi:hypothetical protein